jgi:hypothetical protein
MKNNVLLAIVFFLCSQAFGQNALDSLACKRQIFTSSVYLNGIKQTNKKLNIKYKQSNAFESERLLHRSKILLPIGAAATVGGFAVGIDALIGTEHTAYIDNVEHTYYKRPIFKLISGIGMIAAGVCIMEFSNDARIKSTKVYNQKLKSNDAKTSVGFLPSGNVGVRLDF